MKYALMSLTLADLFEAYVGALTKEQKFLTLHKFLSDLLKPAAMKVRLQGPPIVRKSSSAPVEQKSEQRDENEKEEPKGVKPVALEAQLQWPSTVWGSSSTPVERKSEKREEKKQKQKQKRKEKKETKREEKSKEKEGNGESKEAMNKKNKQRKEGQQEPKAKDNKKISGSPVQRRADEHLITDWVFRLIKPSGRFPQWEAQASSKSRVIALGRGSTKKAAKQAALTCARQDVGEPRGAPAANVPSPTQDPTTEAGPSRSSKGTRIILSQGGGVPAHVGPTTVLTPCGATGVNFLRAPITESITRRESDVDRRMIPMYQSQNSLDRLFFLFVVTWECDNTLCQWYDYADPIRYPAGST